VLAPDARKGWPFAAAARAANVMASPFTVALATRWIVDGTADQILRFIRAETAARQQLAAEILPPGMFKADRLSFNIWARLPEGWTRSAFIGHMRSTGIGVVCIGGPTSRDALRHALEYMAHALTESPAVASVFL